MVVGTPSGARNILSSAEVIIKIPVGKKTDPEKVCFVMAAVFEWYSASFPLALQCFYTAKYNKWRICRRKWEHATIIAWERSRAGTPAWPSSCSPHGTNALVAPQQLWPFLSSVVVWFIILVALCRAYYCLCFSWQMCNQKETVLISSTCYTNAIPLATLLPLTCFPFCSADLDDLCACLGSQQSM